MSGQPWFSIITPSLDRADGLCRAVRSVLAQRFDGFEHIVVDGASVDGTRAVLEAYPHVRAVIEPDAGIYDALNKGVAIARGRWCVFLNTDDALPDGALEALARAGDHAGAPAQLGGWASFSDPDGRRRGRQRSSMDLADSAFGAPVFNARAFSMSLLRGGAPFDRALSIAGDRDYLLRLRLAHASFGRIERTVYDYTVHAGSLTLSEPSAERAALVAREHASIADRLLAATSSRAERAVLRAWLAHERSHERARVGGAHPGRGDGAWRILALGLKARTVLRRS